MIRDEALRWRGPDRPRRSEIPAAVLVFVDGRCGGRRCVDCAEHGFEDRRKHADQVGVRGASLDLDHVHPLGVKGSPGTVATNLVWRCASHNRGRGKRRRAPRVPAWLGRV